jgi:hypothetical protein
MDKSLRKWLSGVLLVTPVLLTSCSLNLSVPQLNESDKAEFVMQTMTSGQQAYYQANGQFANSIQGLSLNASLDTGEYRLFAKLINPPPNPRLCPQLLYPEKG